METFGATAYSDNSADPRWLLAKVPDIFALRLDLSYPDGGKVVLIYDDLPGQKEQADLMWNLQLAAGQSGFTITRTEADGSTTSAPAIGGNDR